MTHPGRANLYFTVQGCDALEAIAANDRADEGLKLDERKAIADA